MSALLRVISRTPSVYSIEPNGDVVKKKLPVFLQLIPSFSILYRNESELTLSSSDAFVLDPLDL